VPGLCPEIRYDAQTGDLEVGMLVTDGQGWNGEVTFAVILTHDTAARFVIAE
jgi:hypothetical protein